MVDRLNPILLKYKAELEADQRSKVFAPLSEGLRKLGLVDEAITCLSRGLKHHPHYIQAYLILADCYIDLEKYEDAFNLLRPWDTRERDNLKFLRAYGHCAEKLMRPALALETYKSILYIAPGLKDITEKVAALEEAVENKGLEHAGPSPITPVFDIEEASDQWEVVQNGTTEANQELLQDELEQGAGNIEFLDTHSLKNSRPSDDAETHDPTACDTVFGHGLIDLYLKQGSVQKAIVALEAHCKLNPEDENSLRRMNELKNRLWKQESLERNLRLFAKICKEHSDIRRQEGRRDEKSFNH